MSSQVLILLVVSRLVLGEAPAAVVGGIASNTVPLVGARYRDPVTNGGELTASLEAGEVPFAGTIVSQEVGIAPVGLGDLDNGVGLLREFGFRQGYSHCPRGLERTIYGECVEPLVSQDLYVYKAPNYKVRHENAIYEHKPKVHYNFVFIKSPGYDDSVLKPIVVPPPRQKTLVYLLSQRPRGYRQEVVEVPYEPNKPEVFFVNYNEGENPVLPGGVDLRTALSYGVGPAPLSAGQSLEHVHGLSGGIGLAGKSIASNIIDDDLVISRIAGAGAGQGLGYGVPQEIVGLGGISSGFGSLFREHGNAFAGLPLKYKRSESKEEKNIEKRSGHVPSYRIIINAPRKN